MFECFDFASEEITIIWHADKAYERVVLSFQSHSKIKKKRLQKLTVALTEVKTK